MNMDNWELYNVPTKIINEKCGNNKSVGLNLIRKMSDKIMFENSSEKTDEIIDNEI